MLKLFGNHENSPSAPTLGAPGLREELARARAIALFPAFGLVAATLVCPSGAHAEATQVAQLGPNAGAGPSYGYQPYDDRHPTGFYHPDGMGYGHYYLTQKGHAPRFRAFGYRKFRGS